MDMAVRKLTDGEKETLKEWIDNKIGDLKCPLCSRQEWILGNVLARIQSQPLSGVGYPVAVAVCSHCAYTLAFNAILVGIEKADAPSGEGADDG